ncbi:MAG: GNAT family N-acetyltransferase [Flavobacteriales bacterium]
MGDYQIKKLLREEFHLLIPLMKDCFGINVNIKYFEWKYLHNPAGLVEGYLAISGSGEIAAFYGVIPEFYVINGEERIIYQSCDTMTHSHHRRKGLFQKLALHCYKNLEEQNKLFIVGFGGGQSTPGFLKFGWRHLFNMRTFFYPKIYSWFIGNKADPHVVSVENIELLEKLVKISNANAKWHSNKTINVFKWRLSNPLHEYKLIAKQDDTGAYTSYLSYYVDQNKIVLFDFYFANMDEARQLSNYVKRLLRKSGYKGITAFYQEKSMYAKTLKKIGFLLNPFTFGPLNQKTPFIFFASQEEMNKANKPEQWLIGTFDHDSL